MEAARPVRRACLLLLGALLAPAACAVVGPAMLDVPPGHHAVLGRVELGGFVPPEGVVDLEKVDGTFGQQLPIGAGERDFAIGLPPGRYRVVALHAFRTQRNVSNETVFPLGLIFDVGPEPATYVGTLRIDAEFGDRVRVQVADEYDQTVGRLRARYRDLPATAARRLMTRA